MAGIINTLLSGVAQTVSAGGNIALSSVINKATDKGAASIMGDKKANVGAMGAPPATVWDCPCGHKGNTGKFCAECGKPQPVSASWDCPCGHKGNTGKFCAECGKPQPVSASWDCLCGHKENTGKFCAECGKPKPDGVPQYKCKKCGWEPQGNTSLPKFCPECGNPFN